MAKKRGQPWVKVPSQGPLSSHGTWLCQFPHPQMGLWVRARPSNSHGCWEGQIQGGLEKHFENPWALCRHKNSIICKGNYDVGKVSMKPKEANIPKSTAGLIGRQARGPLCPFYLPSNWISRYHLHEFYCVTWNLLNSWLRFEFCLQNLYTSATFPFFQWHFKILLHCSEGWREAAILNAFFFFFCPY